MTSAETEDLLYELRLLWRRLELVGAKFSVYGQQERADHCAVEAEVARCWIADIEASRP